MSDESTIAQRVTRVKARIAEAAARAGREPREITLLGASKVQSAASVALALAAGLEVLGENYVQEAAEKQPALADLLATTSPDAAPPRWHMIGALQRNKAKLAVDMFDVIQTVDRESLAREIDKRAGNAGRTLDVFLQVNLSGESQKAGIEEEAVPALLEYCSTLEHVAVVGLMTIPAPVDDPNDNRPVFARLRGLAEELRGMPGGERLTGLSMGMSRDFEIAIEEGATVVRVGSELFGPRPVRVD